MTTLEKASKPERPPNYVIVSDSDAAMEWMEKNPPQTESLEKSPKPITYGPPGVPGK